jgi:hypothetical protein
VLQVAVFAAGMIAVAVALVERFPAGPGPVVVCGILAALLAGAQSALLPPREPSIAAT